MSQPAGTRSPPHSPRRSPKLSTTTVTPLQPPPLAAAREAAAADPAAGGGEWLRVRQALFAAVAGCGLLLALPWPYLLQTRQAAAGAVPAGTGGAPGGAAAPPGGGGGDAAQRSVDEPAVGAEGVALLAIGDLACAARAAVAPGSVADSMARIARWAGVSGVVAAGDVAAETGGERHAGRELREAWADQFLTPAHPALHVEWHFVAGDQDWRSHACGRLASPWVAEALGDASRWYRYPDYWHRAGLRDGGVGVDIFFVDTCVWLEGEGCVGTGQLSAFLKREGGGRPVNASAAAAVQRRWLAAQLSASAAPWKVVVGHSPVFSVGERGSSPRLAAELEPLLRQHRVQLYISGGDRSLQLLTRGGVSYAVTGCACTGHSHRDNREVETTERLGAHPVFFAAAPGFASISFLQHDAELRFHAVGRSNFATAPGTPSATELQGASHSTVAEALPPVPTSAGATVRFPVHLAPPGEGGGEAAPALAGDAAGCPSGSCAHDPAAAPLPPPLWCAGGGGPRSEASEAALSGGASQYRPPPRGQKMRARMRAGWRR